MVNKEARKEIEARIPKGFAENITAEMIHIIEERDHQFDKFLRMVSEIVTTSLLNFAATKFNFSQLNYSFFAPSPPAPSLAETDCQS